MDQQRPPAPEALDDLQRRRTLTAAYSRYSRNAGGLGSVIGGGLCLIAFLLNAWVPLGPVARLVLASTPIVWILAKELLRGRLYQQFGVVEEAWTARSRQLHLLLNGFVAVIAAGIVGFVIVGFVLRRGPFPPSLPAIGYLAFMIAMPFLSFRYFHGTEEFTVGIFLICQAAIVLGGGHYDSFFLAIAVAFSIPAIMVGLHQHHQFRRIARQLRSLEPLS